jgi:hypothetical protein
VPATSKRNVYVRPGLSTGDSNAPVVETTWWSRVSSLRQRIESPATMLTVAGWNAVRLIETTFVAAAAGEASASAAASETSMRSVRRMPRACPGAHGLQPQESAVLRNPYSPLTRGLHRLHD